MGDRRADSTVGSSRRAVLGSLGAGITVLSGCTAFGGGRPSTGSGSGSSPNTGIRGTSFEGGDLLVHLQEGHDLTGVNLIAPDGSSFDEATVPAGSTLVRFELLDLRAAESDPEHYPPGQFRLVPIAGEKTGSYPLKLLPEVQIVGAISAPVNELESSRTDLEFEIRNIGSGPTWIYQIVFADAPNMSANGGLVRSSLIPRFRSPTEPAESILIPGESARFISGESPILFEQASEYCGGETHEFSVIVGVASGERVNQPVRAVTEGNASSVGPSDRYGCSKVDIEIIKENSSSES